MADLKQARQDRVLNFLRNTLALDPSDWGADMPAVLARFLSEEERAALAFMFIKSLPAEIAKGAAEDALGGSDVYEPDFVSEAETWARAASPRERGRYAAEALRRMPRRDRDRLIAWAGGRNG